MVPFNCERTKTKLVRNFLRFCLLVVIGSIAVGDHLGNAASLKCTNLLKSTLRIFSVIPRDIEEMLVSTEEMQRTAATDHLSEARIGSRVIAIDAKMGATVSLQHRYVEIRAGDRTLYCDAPASVDLEIGAIRFRATMERRAAMDSCIHQAFMRYATERRQALGTAIDDFISQYQQDIAARLRALKETPASDQKAAAAAFEAGLRSLVIPMAQQFAQKAMKAPQDRKSVV